MQNFEYCVPTKVVFGRDTESRCGELVRECGGTHALVVYGGGSAVRSGLLDRCTDSLKAAGIPYELLGGVKPNPRLSKVREPRRSAMRSPTRNLTSGIFSWAKPRQRRAPPSARC